MFENWLSKNPSHAPKPQDRLQGLSNNLDVFMRNTLSSLSSFLSGLSVRSYVGLIIGFIGILLYTGYQLGQSDKTAMPPSAPVVHESGETVTKLEGDLSLIKGELQERIKSYEGLLKERDAQIKERETVIASLRNEIQELHSRLVDEQNKNAELVTLPGSTEQSISELLKERFNLRMPLRHKGVQMQLSTIIAPKGYLIWMPENGTANGLYIDGAHYALFKCLQKIEPRDLLGETERRNLFFAITVGDKVLSPVPYLNLLPLEEGKHKIKLEPLSVSAENNHKESVVKLMARQVEFIEIDGIDVLSLEGGSRVKLKTFDPESTVQRLAKVLDRMRVQNDCLLEVLTTR